MFFSFDVFGAVFQLPGGLVNDGTVVKGNIEFFGQMFANFVSAAIILIIYYTEYAFLT